MSETEKAEIDGTCAVCRRERCFRQLGTRMEHEKTECYYLGFKRMLAERDALAAALRAAGRPDKPFSTLAWLREKGLPDDHFCNQAVLGGSSVLEKSVPLTSTLVLGDGRIAESVDFHCEDCGHQHVGGLGGICVGCPCPRSAPPSLLDAAGLTDVMRGNKPPRGAP